MPNLSLRTVAVVLILVGGVAAGPAAAQVPTVPDLGKARAVLLLDLCEAQHEVRVPRRTPVRLCLTNASASTTVTGVRVEVSTLPGLHAEAEAVSSSRYVEGQWTVDRLAPGEQATVALALTIEGTTPRMLNARLRAVDQRVPAGAILRVRVVPDRPSSDAIRAGGS